MAIHRDIKELIPEKSCDPGDVYALWRVPELLPAFMLNGGEVSRFIIGGADVMCPGVYIPVEGLPTFSAGEPWAVKVASVEAYYVPNAGFLEDIVFEDPSLSSASQTFDS
ncbi:hypothetical protein RHGRI_014817 [Rhododendron griersonianum]|uniref:Eukaryotic translation initiation factor 2D-like PUA RNA-binding domain-containing protein n=1 Tax=Rhododendron griersonianum TaxID=479676 RepID=A0AAV6KBF9_9ERIC|nr:hypothetical protein RHGRI_014817 [Rhododendron griersonianum]